MWPLPCCGSTLLLLFGVFFLPSVCTSIKLIPFVDPLADLRLWRPVVVSQPDVCVQFLFAVSLKSSKTVSVSCYSGVISVRVNEIGTVSDLLVISLVHALT